jgi:hypothetical protein
MFNLDLIGKRFKSISADRTAYPSNNFATIKIELKSGEKINIDMEIDAAEELATRAYEAMFDESEQPEYLKNKIDLLEKELDQERGYRDIS